MTRPVVDDAGTRHRRMLGIDKPEDEERMSDEKQLTRRRDEVERRWPDDEHLRMGLRQFDPGPWIYELSHPDGTVETLTEERYYQLLAEWRE